METADMRDSKKMTVKKRLRPTTPRSIKRSRSDWLHRLLVEEIDRYNISATLRAFDRSLQELQSEGGADNPNTRGWKPAKGSFWAPISNWWRWPLTRYCDGQHTTKVARDKWMKPSIMIFPITNGRKIKDTERLHIATLFSLTGAVRSTGPYF